VSTKCKWQVRVSPKWPTLNKPLMTYEPSPLYQGQDTITSTKSNEEGWSHSRWGHLV
jgi:hypothetical protein